MSEKISLDSSELKIKGCAMFALNCAAFNF